MAWRAVISPPLLVALVLGCSTAQVIQAAPGWDCQQGANGEWHCSTGKAKTAEPAAKPAQETAPEPAESREQAKAPAPSPKQEPAVETVRPEPASEPVPAPKPEKKLAKTPEPEPEELPARPMTQEELEAAEARHLKSLQKNEQPMSEQHDGVSSRHAQVAQTTDKPGWNCRAGGKEWDCSLMGPDPRGMTHAVDAQGEGEYDWATAATLTSQDELRFRSIVSRLPKDPWSLACGWHKTEYTKPTDFLLLPEDRQLRERSPIEVRSNYAEMLKNEIADFKGAADLVRGDQRVYGDFVSHNTEAETITAQGNVIYQEKGLSFASDTAFFRMKTNEGVLRNAQFLVQTVPSRGAARVVHIDNKDQSRYDTITYTVCPPGNHDWLIHASSAKMDRSTGRALARNAWVEFKGIPFLYTPIMTFPIDDRRQTGFLTPTWGKSSVSGFDISVPYYFNLGPNYDATFTPRMLTNRGVLFRGETRYLNDWSSSLVSGEYLPHDSLKGISRGSFRIQNRSTLADHLTAQLDINHVSDARYFNELGNLLSFPVNRQLASFANLKSAGSNYSVELRGDYYETIDTTILPPNRPYWRMPELIGTYDESIAGTGLRFNGVSELVYFMHPRDNVDRVTGERWNIRPKLYYPFQTTAGYITPSIALDHTEYWLQWPDKYKAGRSDSMSRTAPIFSVDSGAFFDREFNLGGSAMQQTLEPRLYYLYVPKVDQDQIPIFDTGVYDFNFYQLFRENRFAGRDRLADSNQFTAAITTRLVEQDTGLERVRASLGNIFYFTDQTVTLPCDNALTASQSLYDYLNGTASATSPSVNCVGAGANARPVNGTRSNSNLVGEIASQLSDVWSLRTTGQWNPEADRIDRGQVGLQYNNKANHLFNLSYRYRRDPITGKEVVQQTDTSLRLPVANGWFISGRWQYSFLNSSTVETSFGIERETCCWRLGFVAARFLNGANTTASTGSTTSSPTYNDTFFVQFELKGLTRFGDQIDQFFVRSISGFRGPTEVFGVDPYRQ